MKAIFSAIFFSLLGVGLFLYLELPLPWLLGSIFPLLFLSRSKTITLEAPSKLVPPARVTLGIAIGSSFTPEILNSLNSYLISLLFLIPFLFFIIYSGYVYYHRLIGYDKSTSMFCALPGGLLEMSIICEANGGHLKRVLTTHATRVLLIVYGIPILIQLLTPVDLSGSFAMQSSTKPVVITDVIILISTALFGWWFAQKLKLSGSTIVGPMTTVALLSLSGTIDYKLHGEIINLAQLILGMRLGLMFQDIKLNEVLINAMYACGLFIILLFFVGVFAYAIHFTTDIPLIATALALIPGGQAEMNIVAIIVGIHIPYIALHHVTRMFLVIAFAPSIVKLAR